MIRALFLGKEEQKSMIRQELNSWKAKVLRGYDVFILFLQVMLKYAAKFS